MEARLICFAEINHFAVLCFGEASSYDPNKARCVGSELVHLLLSRSFVGYLEVV